MANRIAGITIEIGGDTSKLQSSLKGVDSQLRTTKNNLRDINKLLKLDPGNTELLTQKQKNLTQAIGDTKDRLKKLQDAQSAALSPEEYDNLQREIIATKQDLKDLEDQYKDFGSVSAQKLIAVGDKISETGEKITTAGKNVTKYFTTPVVGLGVAAVAAFGEVDEGMDIIIKKTGATGDALDEMGGIMQEIAAEIPTDFKTAGEAVGEVNTRFGSNGEELKRLSAQYIKFAEINDTDVVGSVDSTQRALTAFGKGAESAGTYLDHLSLVSQQTGVDVTKLSEGAANNATAFREMGLSLYGATTFMGQLEVSGANSSAVMGGLSKALKTATEKGIPLDTALAKLQETIKNGTDETDGLTEAYKLFGKSGAQVYQAVRNGTIDFTNLSNAADGMSNTVTETFNATLDPADQFKTALNSLKELGASLAETVMPLLATAIGKVRDIILSLKEKWDGLDETQKQNILRIAGVVAAVGPLLLGIGNLVTKVGSAVTMVGNLTKAFVTMSPKARLIGAVVTAAAALIISHWDEIKEFWETTLKPAMEDLRNYIVDNVVPKVKKAWEDLKPKIEAVFNAIKNLWLTVLKPALTAMWTWITQTLLPAIKKGWDNLKPAIEAVFKGIQTLWNTILKPVFNAIKKLVVDTVVPKVTKAWDTVSTAFEKTFNAISTWWSAHGENIMRIISNAIDTYVGMISGYFSGLIEFINGVFSGDWSRAWNGIKSAFGSIFSGLWTLLKNPINGVINGLNVMIGKVESAINGIVNAFNKKLSIHLDPIKVFGKQVFAGLDWSPNLKGVNFGRLKTLYAGGVLNEGERAVVGEFAPEYLTVRNGQAVVTPMQGAARFGSNTTNNVTLNVYAQPGQSARDIAREAIDIMTRETRQRSAAYA